jgi:hypothetical protein
MTNSPRNPQEAENGDANYKKSARRPAGRTLLLFSRE